MFYECFNFFIADELFVIGICIYFEFHKIHFMNTLLFLYLVKTVAIYIHSITLLLCLIVIIYLYCKLVVILM